MSDASATLELVNIEHPNSSKLVETVKASLDEAMQCKGKLTDDVINIMGMSGKKYRYFINNVIEKIDDASYIEIGSWAGSTLCSAIHKNKVRAMAIDNWSQFDGPVKEFFKNLSNNCSKDTQISVLTEDFRRVDYGSISKFKVFLFDGPHTYQDQLDGLLMPIRCLEDEFILIVDDWNFAQVRSGTLDAIKKLNLSILYHVEIRTTLNNSQPLIVQGKSDWHNGYFISVLKKQASSR